MRDERIGNDINIAWKIQSGDSPFPLEGKNVTLYLHHPYGKQKVEGFRLEGNKVIWKFKGADQKYVGKHGLTLVVNEGANGMITTDSCDFVNLVSCSCQVGGEDNDGVQTEAIELTSTLGFIAYDDTKIREELSRLETNKADKSELTELSAEVSGLSEGIALRNVGAEDTDERVEEPDLPAPSASNEWKCVFDGRLEEGAYRNIFFTTYADGTPLKAKELMVQVLCDRTPSKTLNGYMRIKSSKNQTACDYGAFYYESTNASETAPVLQQIHISASPFFTIARIDRDVKATIAALSNAQVQGGSKTSLFQVYEDIVYVELQPNSTLTSAAPYLKIYAR